MQNQGNIQHSEQRKIQSDFENTKNIVVKENRTSGSSPLGFMINSEQAGIKIRRMSSKSITGESIGKMKEERSMTFQNAAAINLLQKQVSIDRPANLNSNNSSKQLQSKGINEPEGLPLSQYKSNQSHMTTPIIDQNQWASNRSAENKANLVLLRSQIVRNDENQIG